MEFNKFRKLSPQKIGRVIKTIENPELLRKLLRKVRIEPEKKCWITNEDWSKYVHFNYTPAHRWIFQTLNGPIESDKIICHKCDRPGCINPEHLYKGTARDNFTDAFNRSYFKPLAGKSSHPWGRKFEELREQDRIRQLRRFAGEP